eukprot:237344_1
MATPDITSILNAACSPEGNVRQPAEQQLKALENQNLAQYLTTLCTELGNSEKPPMTRNLAGILLKNSITSKSEAQQNQLRQRWLLMPAEVRQSLRQTVFQLIGCQGKDVRRMVALVLARIACVEVVSKNWNDLIRVLLDALQNAPNDDYRVNVYQCLQIICEEIPDYVSEYCIHLLEAIATGMKKDQANVELKLAATKALLPVLHFAQKSWENEAHRKMIMMMIFEATQCEQSEEVRHEGLRLLVFIAELYYNDLGPFIEGIFRMTHQMIRFQPKEVVCMALEFWISMALTEAEIAEEITEAREMNRPPPHQLHNFVNKALEHLVPLLLEALTRQDEDFHGELWTPAAAAAACLQSISQCARDAVVTHVLSFVQNKINDPEWRFRDAAICVFGSILDGPSPQKLHPLVVQAFPVILNHTKDKQPHVAHSAVWTIGRICKYTPQAITPEILPGLMETFLVCLTKDPKIAALTAWAINNLAEVAQPNEQTSPLSQFFDGLVSALLQTTQRSDADEENLLAGCYEAIIALISSAAPDVFESVEKLIDVFTERLQKSTAIQGDRRRADMEQALMPAGIQIILEKLPLTTIQPKINTLMQLFLFVLQNENASVHEEVIGCLGSFANHLGTQFEPFFEAFKPYLVKGLRNHEEFRLCQICVNCVGDIFRALKVQIKPNHCNDLVAQLLQDLQNPDLERTVKPHIISALGDLAISIGVGFEHYRPYVMLMLVQASQTTFDSDDIGDIDYLNELRESILGCYSMILQGLHDAKMAQNFKTHVESTVALVDLIVKDENRDIGVVSSALATLGDIIQCVGKDSYPFLQNSKVLEGLINLSGNMHDENIKKNRDWLMRNISSMK